MRRLQLPALALVVGSFAFVGLAVSLRGLAAPSASGDVLAPGVSPRSAVVTKTTSADDARVHRVAASLQVHYDTKAKLWRNGWWMSGSTMTTMIDYMELSGSREYSYIINEVYEKNKNEKDKKFINIFYDDMAWWGLAWLRAYDLTKDDKYLGASKHIADHMRDKAWDNKCGGGVYWKKGKKGNEYKNAVTNELYIKLSAGIHNRIPDDTKYLDQASKGWDWFMKSGMINSKNMINDGLNEDCKNNNGTTWTYNQGTILGAAAEMYKATSDKKYLTSGKKLAKASMADLSKDVGVVKEKKAEACGECVGGNEMMFKGVYVRNLRELAVASKDSEMSAFLKKNADTAWKKARGKSDMIGFHWQGPWNAANSAVQTSGLDLLNSTIKKKLPTNQALKKTTKASSQCSTKEAAKLAVDGSAGTKWCAPVSGAGTRATLTVDMGASRTIKRIRILHAGAGAEKVDKNTKDFTIQLASKEAGPWKQAVRVKGNASSSTIHAIKATSARFVRVQVTNGGSDKKARIYELAVE